ncbi:hypothetical protein KFK09_020652 [Dendrobium nobile]|uniref:AP2/ERF domain-containing protein n=1 Tax=Dendrobium nobile TaxID=94219 RepID=A0A8T3AN12_DENNO|nr:hypothetical protein KFK09_020652 [Dendrobium nobile]
MATASASSSEAIGAAKAEASGGEWPTIDEPQPGVVLKKARKERVCTAKERISRMPPCAAGKRSSIYRGVTRHRWTGRYEAHLWDKSTWNQNQNKKGKQVYLGAYDDEEAAARAYDLAALKYWGAGTLINFPVSDYARDLEEMQMVSKEDYLVSLRRKSSAFSRGFTKFRGIQRQPQSTRWEAPFGQMLGNEYYNCSTSRDPTTEGKYAGGFGMERKMLSWYSLNLFVVLVLFLFYQFVERIFSNFEPRSFFNCSTITTSDTPEKSGPEEDRRLWIPFLQTAPPSQTQAFTTHAPAAMRDFSLHGDGVSVIVGAIGAAKAEASGENGRRLMKPAGCCVVGRPKGECLIPPRRGSAGCRLRRRQGSSHIPGDYFGLYPFWICLIGAYVMRRLLLELMILLALKYWGAGTLINFPVSDFARDLEEMQMVSKEDYLAYHISNNLLRFSMPFTSVKI